MSKSDSSPLQAQDLSKTEERIVSILKSLESQIEQLDSLQLLSELSLQNFYWPVDQPIDSEDVAKSVRRCELVAWLALRKKSEIIDPNPIDGRVFDFLYTAIDEYYSLHMRLWLDESINSKTDTFNEAALQDIIRTETAMVRGEAHLADLKSFAIDLYSSHRDWMRKNIGFSVEEAFFYVEKMFEIISGRIKNRAEYTSKIVESVLKEWNDLLNLPEGDIPHEKKPVLTHIRNLGIEKSKDSLACWTFYADANKLISVSPDEIAQDKYDIKSVSVFLETMSKELGSITSDIGILNLNPLYEYPLIRNDHTYFAPIPGILYEALINRIHFLIYGHKEYRHTYDAQRSQWMEKKATETFNKILPGCQTLTNALFEVEHKKYEIDGIVHHDNRLILIGAKWKRFRLVSQQGNVKSAIDDLNAAVTDSLTQTERADNYIFNNEQVEFCNEAGQKLSVCKDTLKRIYHVSVVSNGNLMASLCASLGQLQQFGLITLDKAVWAIPVIDLLIISEFFESPSMFFDFLERRLQVQQDCRIHAHDEIDYVGSYLGDFLYPDSSEYNEFEFVVQYGTDIEINKYLYSKHNPVMPRVEKPRRKIPPFIKWTLDEVEKIGAPNRTDFCLSFLSLPIMTITSIEKQFMEVMKKTQKDKNVHSISVIPTGSKIGYTFVSIHNNPKHMQAILIHICETNLQKHEIAKWVGIGIDTSRCPNWFSVFYDEKHSL